jgi:hypothetical protein
MVDTRGAVVVVGVLDARGADEGDGRRTGW